jgi:hypothetical protein
MLRCARLHTLEVPVRALLLPLLLAAPALSGDTDVDIEVAAMGWAGDPSSSDVFEVRKWVGSNYNEDGITESEFSGLVTAAGTSCSALDSEATSVHGSFYTSLGTSAKTKYCDLFTHIAAAD